MQPTVVADLDAQFFARGYTYPLAMMGVALDRYLPGRNAMLANEVYVSKLHIGKIQIVANEIKYFQFANSHNIICVCKSIVFCKSGSV